jgi:phospholipid transport system substrate-binding protein
MQSHLALWIVVCGIATTVTGCVSMESSSGPMPMLFDTIDQQGWKRLPSSISVDSVIQPVPTKYSPTESVKSTISELLSILGNEALKQSDKFEERRQQIARVIRQRVNYEQMAQRSLGAVWTTLSDTERQDFVRLYVQLLRDTFANQIDQYYDEQIVYLFERRVGSFAEVSTKLIGSKVDTWLDFRLADQSGDWLVYDVVIDGASIVGNYRAQFARMIRDTSYAELVEQMQQRGLVVKVFEKTAPDIFR